MSAFWRTSMIGILASGCAGSAFTIPEGARPVSELSEGTNRSPEVGPGDVLEILFLGRPDLSGEFLVNEDGAIQYPFAGRVPVAGMTGDDAGAALRAALKDFFETPDIAITPLIRVNVLGAVVQPGLYPLNAVFSVFDAIGTAGGPSRDADFEQILLVRGGNYFVISTREALREGRNLSRIGVRSGDVILVPERPHTAENLARLSAIFAAVTAVANTILIVATR